MHYPFTGFHGCESVCDLELTVAPDGSALAVLTEVPDNAGTSVTNMAEQLATRLCHDNKAINPTRLTWIEHYPERGSRLRPYPPTWATVRFERYNAVTGTFHHPDWRYITEQAVNDIRQQFLDTLQRQISP